MWTLKGDKPIKMWIDPVNVESSALDQLRNVAMLDPVVEVCAMPDVHTGKGATVGSVIIMKDAVIPAAVGVDIGCGMDAIRTNLKVPRTKKLEEIRDGILDRVPVGFNSHKSINKTVKATQIWETFPKFKGSDQYKQLAMQQMGTLGGGNHFIELSTDQNGDIWIVLHSGSRRIGKEVADFYIKEAMNLEHNQSGLPDKALSYLKVNTDLYDNYMRDLNWAQMYAELNRQYMMTLIVRYLEHEYSSFRQQGNLITCHHNFARNEIHDNQDVVVIRKGAISAEQGRLGIIPGAMGAKSFIVEGLGNTTSWNSAPHGAGRRMSRSQAKKKYTLDDLQGTMKNIVNNACKYTIDEISYSYKDIDNVIELSKDLVKPLYTLEQIMNIKG